MPYFGIDWGTRKKRRGARLTTTANGRGCDPSGRGRTHEAGALAWPRRTRCVEMMSGAVWVRDRLAACGWEIQIAEPRKVKGLARLACKTDRVDARVLAELVRRDLVPEVW